MKVYYQNEHGTLYHGDCLNVMDLMPILGGDVDAVITDPPFFAPASHYQSRVEWGRCWSDISILQTWWGIVSEKLKAVCKKEGHVLVFCNGDSYPAFYPAMYPHWAKLKCLVWDKGHVGLGRIWRNQHELIIAGRNKGHFVPQDRELRADVFTFKATPSKKRLHPVEKPVGMLEHLIRSTTVEGETVFDPFSGGGSLAIAAQNVGRKWILVEKEEKYCSVIAKRLADKSIQNVTICNHSNGQHLANKKQLPGTPK